MTECKQCGELFRKGRKEQFLCSPECSRNHRKVSVSRECIKEGCEKKFTSTPSEKKVYCSRSCAVSVSNLGKVRNRVNGTYALKTCAGCGKKTTNPKYCTSECFHKTTREDTVRRFEGGAAVSVSNPTIYEHLLAKQSGKCKICGMVAEWQGKPIVFVRDHEDGNPDNHEPANVRLICSNCDSQLDTYKAKNYGNGRYLRRQRYAEGKSY